MKWLLIIICLTFSFMHELKAQPDLVIEEILEEIQEEYADDVDNSELYETLLQYYYNPLNLNTATGEQLASLQFLHDYQVDDILAYRRRYYGFKSIYELMYVPSLDRQTVQRLVYFVYMGDRYFSDTLRLHDLINGRNELVFKLENTVEKQSGYQPVPAKENQIPYAGNALKNLVKFRHSFRGASSYGISMEKDAGEDFFKKTNPLGYDYYSAHFFLNRKNKTLSRIALGDYHLNFGQGLAMHTGFGFGKSANALDIVKSDNGLKPYSSVSEFGFLRGAAVTLERGSFSTSLFLSHQQIDGGIVSDTTDPDEQTYFTSFYENGFHRTENEVAKKNTVTQSLVGSSLSYHLSQADIGVCWVAGSYSPPLFRDTQLYHLANLSADQFYNASVSYKYTLRNLYLFGETAFDGSKFATLNGALLHASEKLSTGIVYRNYSPSYFAPFANAFAESGSISNENGLYWAVLFKPIAAVEINAYLDNFIFPAPKFNVDLPSSGSEFLLDVKYFSNYYLNMYWRFKYEVKDKNNSGIEYPLSAISKNEKINLRYHLNYKLSYNLGLKLRVEYAANMFNQKLSQGFITYQELYFYLQAAKLKIAARYLLFNTDDYNARIYAYESDVLYTFSSPAFSGHGSKYYVLLTYKPIPNINIQFKLGRLRYFDRQTTGSSLQETDVPHKTDLKFLVHLKF